MTSPAEMTQAECGEVLRYARGAQFSEAARRMLVEFFEQRGWDFDSQHDKVLDLARERWDTRSKWAKMGTTTYCEICGNHGAGVTWYGHHRCDKHWEAPPEYGGTPDGEKPAFDWATGFSLTSSPA
jgi:hypothetical protein